MLCDEPGAASVGVLLTEGGALALRQQSLIDRLKPADRERVRQHGRTRAYKRGDILFAQGQPHTGILIIESGLVRSHYTAPSGREMTLAYWSPGNFVGGPEVFGGGLHMWSATAARRSNVTVLPGQALRNLAHEVPDLALAIIDALVFKAKCYSTLAQMLGTRSLTERLGQLLTYLANTYGIPGEEGITIGAAFTHAEIANLIGSTRQWVTISFKRLQSEGVLTHRKGLLIIKRSQALTDGFEL